MNNQNSRYYSTSEACGRVPTYPAHLWSLVGRELSPPFRASPKKVYWLRSEIDALAKERAEIVKILTS